MRLSGRGCNKATAFMQLELINSYRAPLRRIQPRATVTGKAAASRNRFLLLLFLIPSRVMTVSKSQAQLFTSEGRPSICYG